MFLPDSRAPHIPANIGHVPCCKKIILKNCFSRTYFHLLTTSLHVGGLSWYESHLHCSPTPLQQLPCDHAVGIWFFCQTEKYVNLHKTKGWKSKTHASLSDNRLSRSLKTAMSTLAKKKYKVGLCSEIDWDCTWGSSVGRKRQLLRNKEKLINNN